MHVFRNPHEGRLRIGWRLPIQAALAFALGLLPVVAIAEPLTFLHRRGLFLASLSTEAYDHVINMIVGPFLAAAVVASVYVAGRWLDHRPFADFGVRIDGLWWKGLALGGLLGAWMMGFIFVFELVFGWIDVEGFLVLHASGISLALALSFSLVKDVCVGIYEEFVSRGYLLKNLSESFGPVWGVVGSSAVFAGLHALNENASVASMVGLLIAGILLGVAVQRTGRLSSAIGMHITWNLFEGSVFGFPVSGDLEGASLIGLKQTGPELWTGGAFGPEAGLVGILATLLGLLILFYWFRAAPAALPPASVA